MQNHTMIIDDKKGRVCSAHRYQIGGHSPSYHIKSGGFTLAEAMLAMVVLGIAAAGVLLPFTTGAQVRAEGMRQTIAARLASDLIEEIVNTPFNNIEALVEQHQQDEFTDPMYANFTRGAILEPDVQEFFKLVTVWVRYNGREIVSIKRLISR